MTNEEELAYYRKKYADEARNLSDDYFRYERGGKKYKTKLPNAVKFITHVTGLLDRPEPFTVIGFRHPLKNEYYLSGSHPSAYRAPNNLYTPYVIVEPR